MIAGLCASVLLTSGRTVGAENAVIGSIDSAGTRSIIMRAEPSAELDSSVLGRIRNIEGIEWAGAFGAATDVQNRAFSGGTKVPLRLAWSEDWRPLGLAQVPPGPGDTGYGSPPALEDLGLADGVGGVKQTSGVELSVVGGVDVPEHLRFLEPMLVAPQPLTAPGEVGILVVVAERPDLVAAVAAAVTGVLATSDPTKVTVSTSEGLASLRALIEGQLGTFGRSLTLGILAMTAVLTSAILYGIVMLRRKDFGRRRALGASQRLIVALLLIQTGLLSLIGAALGTTLALLLLAISNDPLPGPTYVVGVATLAVMIGLVATLAPALNAASREPITELRVP
ncbi:lipoprotein ABC transporter permease [Leifsonia sp. Root4]|uniref:ABC transporter permease n=1 Tax=Leifsonia sp. Root4 TaxID=1736525 RepID=UPI0006F6F5E6|nr:FtsX-like permease family protein [Leifsonia sp. Root4]KQW08182.1 lipoprotein ABC transporter permease [Leifsonia sp. Root4]